MILMIVNEASLTGAPKMLLALARWLTGVKKEKVEFIIQHNGPLVEQFRKIAPVFIWSMEYRRYGLIRAAWNRLFDSPELKRKRYVNSLKRKKVELIFCKTIANGAILEALHCLNVPVVSKIAEMKTVIDLYNMSGIADKTFKYSDRFIAVSGAVKEDLVNLYGIDSGKIDIVYNGLPERHSAVTAQQVDEIRKRLGIPEDAFIVGACGMLIWRKGIDLFIRLAYKLIKKRNATDFYFIWIGGDADEGNRMIFNDEIKKLELEQFVTITGEIADPYPYYQMLDVFCLPSREEPFGMVLLEAGICGVPVIGFERSGYPPEFITPDVGFTVPYLDVNKMADMIIYLKEHPEVRSSMSAGIIKKSETYSFSEMAERIYDIIQKTRINFSLCT